ncbi:MAG: phosphoribosylanthranilate isomerase [Fuerstiella sp.]|nr:phosphoribosylanthranilate isomerase [Fuerstiella sp.]
MALIMWIKICGIRNFDDADTAAAAGANAIGFNFYQASPRYVSPDAARAIVNRVNGVEFVGVFVNDSARDVAKIVEDVRLTAVQFHGDETITEIQEFQQLCPQVPVIRAFRIGAGTESLKSQLQTFNGLPIPLNAALVDAWSAARYGGTGRTVNADLLESHRQWISRLILAGGLTPDNVVQAVSATRPWGVDTASGVEISPGVKSADLVRKFVSVCRQALPGSSDSLSDLSDTGT